MLGWDACIDTQALSWADSTVLFLPRDNFLFNRTEGKKMAKSEAIALSGHGNVPLIALYLFSLSCQ